MIFVTSHIKLCLLNILISIACLASEPNIKIKLHQNKSIPWDMITNSDAIIPTELENDIKVIRNFHRSFDFSKWMNPLIEPCYPEGNSLKSYDENGNQLKYIDAIIQHNFVLTVDNCKLHYYHKKHLFSDWFDVVYDLKSTAPRFHWKIKGAMFTDFIYPIIHNDLFFMIWTKAYVNSENPYKHMSYAVIISLKSGKILLEHPLDYWNGDVRYSIFSNDSIMFPNQYMSFYCDGRIYLLATVYPTLKNKSLSNSLGEYLKDKFCEVRVLEIEGLK